MGKDDLSTRLLVHLRDRLDVPSLAYVRSVTPLRGGAFSDISTFELAGAPPGWAGTLVLRLVPWLPMQVRVEAGLQDGAAAAGLPAPRILMAETSSKVLGAPFLVMKRLEGRPFLGGIEPLRFARDFPRVIWSWPATFERVIHLLGAVDTSIVVRELERHDVPERSFLTTRHLDRAESVVGDHPAFDGALAWLRSECPPLPEQMALVHGDLWPGNVLMSGGEVSGLVDWTMGAIGDPALDVGFAKVGLLLSPEPFPPPPPARQLVDVLTTRVANEIHRRCALLVGGDDRVRYFEALRCAVQLAAAVGERRSGAKVGWAHGIPALVGHLESITGCAVPFRL